MTKTNTFSTLIEVAVRNRYRFNFKGSVTVEELFDLTVAELDYIFKGLNKELKQVEEESLLATKSKEDQVVENKIAIIKAIVEEKLTALEEAKNAQAKKAQEQQILALIEKKQQAALENLSESELQELLKNL